MDIHYNAFISYRHHPSDIKVAEQIHRGLEHYRIPKPLNQKIHTKLRLFRDKEELPITSNLTDTITQALNNSEYLIVICSPHTRESIWVQREIETFLQTHDRTRILTVIAEGEPYNVIPEILCAEEQLDPITGQTVSVPVEPLSCDWRASKRKAYREELPRLAAALLECGYDELRQRERQYQTRRMAAIFSAALAAALTLSAYVIHNSIKIQQANNQLTDANISILNNLQQAQINQSQFLASAALQQADAGDRMQAMALALEALPHEDNPRPYVVRAEKALADAVGAYLSQEEVAAVGVITCDAYVDLFSATDQRDWLFVTDQRELLSVWELETFQQVAATPLESNAIELLVTPDDTAIVHTENTLTCYDSHLNLLWQTENVRDARLSEDRTEVLLLTKDNTLLLLDAATGESMGEHFQLTLPVSDTDLRFFSFRQEFYDWQQPIILDCYSYNNPHAIVSADLMSGTVLEIGSIPNEYDIRGTAYTEDGNILILAVGNNSSWNALFNTMSTNSAVDVQIICLTPDGKQLWTTELTSYTYADEWTLHPLPGTNQVFCQVDNILSVLDHATGEILSLCQTSGTPLWVDPHEDYAQILLHDGSMGSYYYEKSEFNSIHFFKENLSRGFAGSGVFVNQTYSTEILKYTTIQDMNWQMYTGEYSATVSDSITDGNYLATYDMNSVYIFDTETRELLWEIPKDSYQRFQLLGFTDEGKFFWINSNGQDIIRLHTETGQTEVLSLPVTLDQDDSLYYTSMNRVCMDGDVIHVLAEGLSSSAACVVSLNTQTLQSTLIRLDDVPLDSDCELLIAQAENAYLWCSDNGTLYRINTHTQEVSVFAEGLTSAPFLRHLNDGSTIMFATGESVNFLQTDGTLLFAATLENQTGVSAYRTAADEILLLTDAGTILRYSSTGERLGEVDTHRYNNFSSNLTLDFNQREIQWYETGDGDLFLNIFNAGNLFDMASWEMRAWIPDCIAYIPDLNQFITKGEDEELSIGRIGAFPRYDTEDLRQMALEALNGYTLTPEKKEYYGIS